MAKWLLVVLTRIRQFVASGDVRFTLKAAHELEAMGLDRHDALDMLARLSPTESWGRLHSDVTAEWLYVFKPTASGHRMYVKLILRERCEVVSFHEDDHDEVDD